MSDLLFKPQIMGILNITEDSFSDGNKFYNHEKALHHAYNMISEGVDIIDIGGESTRPGAEIISTEDEVSRVVPVINSLRNNSNITISVDTYKSEVAEKAVMAGAQVINDIYALRYDNKMINVLKEFSDVKIILMHMQGTPKNMQINPQYNEIISDISDFFKERIDFCLKNSISSNRIILDPGIGFGKSFEHNIAIIKNIEKFKKIGLPVLLGASRKSFINSIYESSAENRLIGTLASSVIAYFKSIDIVRVHDVKEHNELFNSLSWMA